MRTQNTEERRWLRRPVRSDDARVRLLPPYVDMASLVGKLTEVIRPLIGRPFACYGVSMGARVAWALAHGYCMQTPLFPASISSAQQESSA